MALPLAQLSDEIFQQTGIRIALGNQPSTASSSTTTSAPRAPPARTLGQRVHVTPATLFTPDDPSLTPEAHFPLQSVSSRCDFPRFVNRFNSREILIAVDGCCLNNGSQTLTPRAGCSFVFKNDGPLAPQQRAPPKQHEGGAPLLLRKPSHPGLRDVGAGAGTVAFALEERGPAGDVRNHTSNRAKLRAVIAALQFRQWGAESWTKVVVLTDLEYVVLGATRWLPVWAKRRWRLQGRGGQGARRRRRRRSSVGINGGVNGGVKAAPGRVENRDLWEALQGRVDELREQGTEVSFWLMGAGNAVGSIEGDAKAAAKSAARGLERGEVSDVEFVRRVGVRT